MKIWVVLPAYNEEQALPPLLDSIIEHFSEDGKEFSVIVVNDGSSDKTGEVIEGYAKK
ncbi:MAG: glycosyltransferase, partial [Deltaproteobacteria bacterium]|nr:glycosyltransferase [Deltaproteobacteria bacterium]